MFLAVIGEKGVWEINFENDRLRVLKIERGGFRVE